MTRKVSTILRLFECHAIGHVRICTVAAAKHYPLSLSLLTPLVKKHSFMCSKLVVNVFFFKFDWTCVFPCTTLKKYYYVFGSTREVHCFDLAEATRPMFCLSFDFYRANIGWVWAASWLKAKTANFLSFFLALAQVDMIGATLRKTRIL